MSAPEAAGRWLRVLILVAWATGLVILLLSVAYGVRASRGSPGVVVLALTSAACAWLLVVVRQLPGWRSRRDDKNPEGVTLSRWAVASPASTRPANLRFRHREPGTNLAPPCHTGRVAPPALPRRLIRVAWGAYLVVFTGSVVNILAGSRTVRTLGLVGVTWGLSLVIVIASREMARPDRGDPLPSTEEALLVRLNRQAAENEALLDALGKVVVPAAAALLALLGVVLTVVFRD